MPTPIKNIPITEYTAKVKHTEHTLIDVRDAEEFAGGYIAGSINIPFSALTSRVNEIPTDKTVVVVCGRGGRSVAAAGILASTEKFEAIIYLDGGISAWQDARKPLKR
jgi:rhodanese-related sulfurtransferase